MCLALRFTEICTIIGIRKNDENGPKEDFIMNNEVLKAMKTRRSIRKYKPEQITDEQLDAILEAGTYAATGMGKQSPVIVVVQKPELIAKLSKMNAAVMGSSNDPFYGAPTVLIVLADPEIGTYHEDGSLVMGNLMLAAHSLGLGSCWIHRAKETFEREEGKAILKELGIEGDYEGIGNCVIGYAKEPAKEAAPRKADYVHYIK